MVWMALKFCCYADCLAQFNRFLVEAYTNYEIILFQINI